MKGINLKVNGIVQGVGFRPFIHKLITKYKLYGWVKNSSTGVIIQVEGEEEELQSFINDIKLKSPKLAVIESVSWEYYDELKYYDTFEIVKSTDTSEKFTLISPDVCICDECLEELFDKDNKRYRFPFINCTNCGPRFTIIKDIPYDRDKTTMYPFKMCDECNSEYQNIENRRYHAQPNCCYSCGPELFFVNSNNESVNGDPIEITKSFIKEGKIVAIKGLGGFHIACDALRDDIVKELRKRKHREEKPFAVMCKNMEVVKKYCIVSDKEEELLTSFRRPIVLLKKKTKDFEEVSKDNSYLGVMLPYTPVHYLVMEDNIEALVMTSGNISDYPIISDNIDAVEKLKEVADGFLMNNRDIHIKCDDSLVRVFDNKEYPIRRSRGYAPFPIKVNNHIQNILAFGGEQKASFSVSKGNYIFLSQHIGDMKNIEILDNYSMQIKHFINIFGAQPSKLVCDLHPDYLSTEYAQTYSKKNKLPLCYVQHHHAHMASCMIDNNIDEDVIGIIWDGTGYGLEGDIWGAEFLLGGFSKFKRAGSIKSISLPGGDKAIKDIYRIAYSLIFDAMGYIPNEYNFNNDSDMIIKMLKGNINSPRASSMGRLFDGIAAILKLKLKASYEGQGAIILENEIKPTKDMYSINVEKSEIYRFDWMDMIREILYDINLGLDKGIISCKFMNTIIGMSVKMTKLIRNDNKINKVVLSGGVFQNMYLLNNIYDELKKEGFEVYHHNRVSTNDEGISVGQIAVAQYGGDFKCV